MSNRGRNVIDWVREYAIPAGYLKYLCNTPTRIVVTFSPDEKYLLCYYGNTATRPIDGWLAQSLCDRVSRYTIEEFLEKAKSGTRLEIYQYKEEKK
ncbi:MAG: hypothetical protein DDT23_00979 [candidate division WS2 bacterium]|nr:hypothetical protein [Candidatus Lithacetigena glycinireducens]